MASARDTEVLLSYYYLKTHDVTDYGQPTLGPGFRFPAAAGILRKVLRLRATTISPIIETHIATFRIDHKLSDELSVRNTLRWANYQRDMEATIATLNATDANGNPVTAATPFDLLLANRIHNKSRDNDDEALINQTDLIWKVETGAIKHTVLDRAGALAGEARSLELQLRCGSQYGRRAGAFVIDATARLRSLYQAVLHQDALTNVRWSRRNTAAVFVQDQMEFSPQWKALVGLRWEYYDTSDARPSMRTPVQ